ncbi:pilus assembly protein Flp/PilA [Formivibrio citricus]|uniref:Pilus assembly protein Flp/PilA n=1 Tax=Formivibrio citricus TaxID=83765 RepID=A0A1I4WXQ6_9NEIS|nr:Flp family type IVb pilin [Formivibrio citricus]SFN18514.1 pilus assembly protein Flp/PilA [Formivibrio citricus]
MKRICLFLRTFCKDQEGVTAIEYALLASLIAVAILGGLMALSSSLQEMWTRIADCVSNPSGCAS